MSLLLVDGPDSQRWRGVALALIDRLVAADDQVRVVLRDAGDAGVVKVLRDGGVHIAVGDASNGDLMERAAQGCRSIILFDPPAEVLTKAIEAARFARVERLIVCALRPRDREDLTDAVPSFVWLVGRPKGIVRGGVASDAFAAAIDAADDIAGNVELDLDLTTPEAWKRLDVPGPKER